MNGNITVLGQHIFLPKITHKTADVLIVPMLPASVYDTFAPKPMTKLKYKFSRTNWYVAEFDDKYYFEVEKWCAEQFGPHPRNPDAWSRWYHKYQDRIHFRDSKDYEWFMLRWS